MAPALSTPSALGVRLETATQSALNVRAGLDDLRARHATWSTETFGTVGPTGALKHLALEAREATAAPDDLEECADLQFLLWDAQRRAGISDAQLLRAGRAKFGKLKCRHYPEPVEGEPTEHVRGTAD